MADASEKVREFLTTQPLLEPSESVLAAAKAMPLGQIKKQSKVTGAKLVGGAVGALVASARESQMSPEDLHGKMRNGVYLVATDRRLYLIAAGGLRGLPHEHVGTVERSRISKIESGSSRISLVKLLTITFTLDDETELAFEFPKVDVKGAEKLLAALGQ